MCGTPSRQRSPGRYRRSTGSGPAVLCCGIGRQMASFASAQPHLTGPLSTRGPISVPGVPFYLPAPGEPGGRTLNPAAFTHHCGPGGEPPAQLLSWIPHRPDRSFAAAPVSSHRAHESLPWGGVLQPLQPSDVCRGRIHRFWAAYRNTQRAAWLVESALPDRRSAIGSAHHQSPILIFFKIKL